MSTIAEEKILELKEMDGGEGEILKQVIQLYLEDSPSKLEQMELNFKQKNYKALRAYAHSLRSSSLNVGANVLAALLKDIEYGEDPGYDLLIADRMPQVHNEYQKAKTTLGVICKLLAPN